MIRLFRNLQNFKDIFKKKNQKFWGAQAPLGHQVAPPLDYKKVCFQNPLISLPETYGHKITFDV